jgi:hypothetical protein
MRGYELCIQQLISTFNQAGDEVDEGDFACIALAAEHAFAEESRAKRDAIEAADQFAAPPAFNGMGMAVCVQG